MVLIFMSFIATPTVVYALNLDLDTSVCFQTNEEEQETISKVDFKQLFKENSSYFSLEDTITTKKHLFYKENSIKYIALATFSPPPESLS